jgi:hypothetical protein
VKVPGDRAKPVMTQGGDTSLPDVQEQGQPGATILVLRLTGLVRRSCDVRLRPTADTQSDPLPKPPSACQGLT